MFKFFNAFAPVRAAARRAGTIALNAGVVTALAFAPGIPTLVDTAEAKSRISLIRDAEIEALIQDYAKPIFAAAGLPSRSIKIYLINRPEFNAFVSGNSMFINLGAIQISNTPGEIKGVIAHETGHVIGGHLIRLRDRADKAKVLAAITTILGAGAAAIGGKNGSAAGSAIIAGGGQLINSQMLAYQRSEEAAADQAAIRLLNKTGQSAKGLLDTFERFSRNDLFSSQLTNPYTRSHPMPRDRIALLAKEAKSSPNYNKSDSKALQLRHDMARAKIAAYTGGGQAVRGLFSRRLNSAPARYGNAIATFLTGNYRQALPQIDRLIKEQPKNPYLWEMKGEILYRSGKAAQAIKPFQKAVRLDRHNAGILRVELGSAYLQSGNPKYADKAIKNLKTGLGRDRSNTAGYAALAQAYASQGNEGLALATTAESYMNQGRLKEAKRFAKRALPHIKKGSPQWVRLKDIIDFNP